MKKIILLLTLLFAFNFSTAQVPDSFPDGLILGDNSTGYRDGQLRYNNGIIQIYNGTVWSDINNTDNTENAIKKQVINATPITLSESDILDFKQFYIDASQTDVSITIPVTSFTYATDEIKFIIIYHEGTGNINLQGDVGVTFTSQTFSQKHVVLYSDTPNVWKHLDKGSNIGGTSTPAGNDTEIQFNDGGAFGGSDDFVWDNVNGQLGVDGNITVGTGDTIYSDRFESLSGAITLTDGNIGITVGGNNMQSGDSYMNIGREGFRYNSLFIDDGEINTNGQIVSNITPTSSGNDIRQILTTAPYHIISTYTASAYHGGMLWSTSDADPTKPFAGIYTQKTSSGSKMFLKTSNAYALGLNTDANGIIIDYEGKLGIGTVSPTEKLEVNGNALIKDGVLSLDFTGQTSQEMVFSGVGSNTHSIGGGSTLQLDHDNIISASTMRLAYGSANKYVNIGSSTATNNARLFLKGGGNDNTTTAFRIDNSDDNTLLSVKNNGDVIIGDYTLPNTDGTSDQVLKTDGSGTVTWQDEAGGGAAQKTITIIASGQSNMLGADGFITDGGDKTTDSRVKVWNGSSFITADLTLAPFAQGPSNDNNNLAFHFAKALAEKEDAIVQIIFSAFGGNSISNWVGAGTSSTNWVAITDQITASGVSTIDGFIWHQGESDSASATYPSDVQTLMDQFYDLSQVNPSAKFIAGEVCHAGATTYKTNSKFYFKFEDYITNPNFNVAKTSERGTVATGNVDLHFDGPDLVKIGREDYFKAWYSTPRQTVGYKLQDTPYIQNYDVDYSEIYSKVHGEFVDFDASGGDRTFRLPIPLGGKPLFLRRVDDTSNTLRFSCSGNTITIDDTTGFPELVGRGSYMILKPDGENNYQLVALHNLNGGETIITNSADATQLGNSTKEVITIDNTSGSVAFNLPQSMVNLDYYIQSTTDDNVVSISNTSTAPTSTGSSVNIAFGTLYKAVLNSEKEYEIVAIGKSNYALSGGASAKQKRFINVSGRMTLSDVTKFYTFDYLDGFNDPTFTYGLNTDGSGDPDYNYLCHGIPIPQGYKVTKVKVYFFDTSAYTDIECKFYLSENASTGDYENQSVFTFNKIYDDLYLANSTLTTYNPAAFDFLRTFTMDTTSGINEADDRPKNFVPFFKPVGGTNVNQRYRMVVEIEEI